MELEKKLWNCFTCSKSATILVGINSDIDTSWVKQKIKVLSIFVQLVDGALKNHLSCQMKMYNTLLSIVNRDTSRGTLGKDCW